MKSTPILLACLALAACAESPSGPPQEITELPRALTVAERALATAGNGFTFSLLRTVSAAAPDSSVFLSPLSASMALGMTLNGAAGETYSAMRGTLGVSGQTQEEINAGYQGLMGLLRRLDATTEIRVANSVWHRLGIPFDAGFLSTVQQSFDAEVAGLDFDAADAVDRINAWVDAATRGRIPTIIDRIDPNDVMFLINAIYFKGRWRAAFDPARTTDADFHAADGRTQRVRMMHRAGPMRVLSREAFDAVDLPYGNGAFTMTVLLPRDGTPIDSLVESLTPALWDGWMAELEEASEVDLYLPRFTLEYERMLNPDLTALGMGIAFDDVAADFSRLSPMGAEMFLSFVRQKTFVQVNEQGTEAAAATAVGVGVTSLPPTIRIDRPFLFAIRERLTGTILFVGKMLEIPPAG